MKKSPHQTKQEMIVESEDLETADTFAMTTNTRLYCRLIRLIMAGNALLLSKQLPETASKTILRSLHLLN
jgi:hypothetical protein